MGLKLYSKLPNQIRFVEKMQFKMVCDTTYYNIHFSL
jgi:hypothetical protein